MDQVDNTRFGVWDYVVFAFMLLLSAAIGVFFAFTGGKQKTADEVLLGNRRMNILAVAMSLAVSFVSAISIIGIPVEIYVYDTMYSWSLIASGLGNLLIVLLIHPVIFRLRITSIYEVRYTPNTQNKTHKLRINFWKY